VGLDRSWKGPVDTGARIPIRVEIPEHELLRCIGTGSYGHVWLARSTTGVWRAVKVVCRELFRDVRPFEREWTGVRRFEPLSRENDAFVDVLQTGRSADGSHFYYVMELADDVRDDGEVRGGARPHGGDVDGYVPRTLSWMLKEGGTMPVEACLVLGQRLARGLVCLHEAGLLHRDIKPSNIVFVGGQPRLADIGLVTDVGEARSFVGTEGFIPPEGPNSPQSDVYGLGKVLYEAMTGLDRMQYPRVPPGFGAGPDGKRLLELNAVVLKACAGRPEDRYPSAEALADDLDRVIAGQSVRASHRIRAGNRSGHPWRWVLAAVVTMVIAGVFWRRLPGSKGDLGVATPAPARSAAPSLAQGVDPLKTLRRTQAFQHLDEGDDAGALVWLADVVGNGDEHDADADRMRIGPLLRGLPVPDSTMDCGPGLLSASFSQDGERVVTSDNDGVVQVWSVRDSTRIRGPWSTGGHAVQVSFAPDDKTLLVTPPFNRPAVRGVQGVGQALRMDAESGQILSGGMDRILWGAFSTDGRWAAGVRASNQVVVSDMTRPGNVRVLGHHTRAVSSVSFSLDGTRVASVSDDRTARLWNVEDGSEVRPPMSIAGMGTMSAFDSSGKKLQVLGWDGMTNSFLEEWDVEGSGGRLGMKRLPGPARWLHYVAGNPGTFLAANRQRGFWIERAASVEVGHEILLGRSPCRHWAVSVDGRHLVAGGDDGVVRVWELSKGNLVALIPRHSRPVIAVAFSPDGSRILTASMDGLLRVWSGWLSGAMGLRELPGLAWGSDVSMRRGVVASMDRQGAQVLVAARHEGSKALVIADVGRSTTPFIRDLPPEFEMDTVEWSQDGTLWSAYLALSVDPASPTQILMGRHQRPQWSTQFRSNAFGCRRVVFDPDGRHAFAAGDSGDWMRWDLASGESVRQPVRVPSPSMAALSDDGRLLAWVDSSTRGVEIREWDRPGVLRSWSGVRPIRSLLFVPESTWLVVEEDQQGRVLVDARTGKPVPIPPGSLDGGILSDWHAPTQRVLHVLESARVEIVDLRSQRIHHLPSSPGERGILFTQLSRDGLRVAVADWDQGIRVFDAGSGIAVSRRLHAAGRIRWMRFTPEGNLVTLIDPNHIQTWALKPFPGDLRPLKDWASILSGRRIDAQGGLEWLTPPALSALARRVPPPF